MSRRIALATGAGVLVLALSACGGVKSQVGGLAAVSGDRTAAVQAAAIDVLMDKKIDVLVWPDCTSVGKVTTCAGKTVAGEPIVVDSPATNPTTMVITVAGKELFSGEVQPILNEAAGKS